MWSTIEKSSRRRLLLMCARSCRRHDVQQFRQVLQANSLALMQESAILQANRTTARSSSNYDRSLDNTSTYAAPQDKSSTIVLRNSGSRSCHEQAITTASRTNQKFKQYNIFMPAWFTSQTWAISFGATQYGWQFHLRNSNQVPHNAPIYDACHEGNILEVKRLFQNGLASPYDFSSGAEGERSVLLVGI